MDALTLGICMVLFWGGVGCGWMFRAISEYCGKEGKDV